LHQGVGDGVILVDLHGDRLDLLLDEIAHRIAQHFMILG